VQVFLIRHPQPDVASGLCYGQTDLVLLKEPSSLAQQIAYQLPKKIPLYSSPLLRCQTLAEALSNQLDIAPIYDDRLKEINFGAWEMQAWSGIPRQQLDDWAADPFHYLPPDGESIAQLQQRVLDFIEEKDQQHQTIALVTHAGVMKILFAHARARHVAPLPINEWMTLSFDYGSLEKINWGIVAPCNRGDVAQRQRGHEQTSF
jgi:alpha-ribazole phosphatase